MFLPFFVWMSTELRNCARREMLVLEETKCGGPQTFPNRFAVSCPYVDKGTRRHVQLRLPNLARMPIQNLESLGRTYGHGIQYML